MKALLQQALDALENRLKRIEAACMSTAPKQAVGEMVTAMRGMPEWDALRAAIAQKVPMADLPESYCATCEKVVSGPCNSVDCSTPDVKPKLSREDVIAHLRNDATALDYSNEDSAIYSQAADMLEAGAAIAQGEPEPAWFACDTEGADFDITFCADKEEAMSAVQATLEDNPDLKFEDLVTPLYTHPAPYVPLTDETVRDLAKESGLDWQRGYMPLFDDDPTNRYAVFAEAIERAVRSLK